MIQINSGYCAFVLTLKTCGCLFILILFPLSMFYQLDSIVLSFNAHIIVAMGLMVVFFFVLALLCALIAGFIYYFCSILFKKEAAVKIIIFYNVIALAAVVYEFARTFKLWFSSFFGVAAFMPLFVKLIIFILFFATFFLVFLFKDRAAQIFEREINIFFKAVIVIVALSTAIIVAQISHTYFQNQPMDTVTSVVAGINKSKQQNIILVTFDALTANDMSLYGYGLKTTPNMDLFSQESYIFTDMYANSNWTRPSVASILTGTYPSTHKLINGGEMNCILPDSLKNRNIASILRNNGYQTAAIVSNLRSAHPLVNDTINSFDYCPVNTIDAEYKKYDMNILDLLLEPLEQFFIKNDIKLLLWLRETMSSNIIMIVFQEIKSRTAGKNKWGTTTGFPPELTFNLAWQYMQKANSPFFLWVHVFTPHDPYLPVDRFKKQFLQEDFLLSASEQVVLFKEAVYPYPKELQPQIDKLRLRYDEHILYTDHEFGVFLNKLRQGGFLDTSIVVVSADHGESFNHGYLSHGGPTLHNDLIHIPLIIHTPKQQHHRKISQTAEQVDITPTIMDLLKIDIPPWLEGKSVKKAMDNQATSNKPIFSMNLDGNYIRGQLKKGTVAVIKDKYKFIYYLSSKKGELYNLASDPNEFINLVEIDRERVEAMKNLILCKISVQ